jgi:hypothetical protein
MPSFQYQALSQQSDNIRLLRLMPPDRDNAPIRCHLVNYSLAGEAFEHQYEALSYTWGDLQKTVQILLDDCPFYVTVNLHSALSRLRSRAIEWLWVDAICIDQENSQERAHQVRYMAMIYGKAHRVNVWLGDADEDSDRVFDEMHANRKWTTSLGHETTQQAVLAFLARPWFRRIWVGMQINGD